MRLLASPKQKQPKTILFFTKMLYLPVDEYPLVSTESHEEKKL